MYYHFRGKVFKKRLIPLPKTTIFIKDRFYSIYGCDLLQHPSTEHWSLLKASEKFEDRGDGNSEQDVVVSRNQSFTTRRYGWVEAFCVILPLLFA